MATKTKLFRQLNPFSKGDTNGFPEVVVPLADASAPSTSTPNAADSGSDQEGKDKGDSSSQEKGAAPPSARNAMTMEALRAGVEADIGAAGHDSVYDRKAKIINRAIQDVGMGRYQWELFVLCGFGWTADNLWLQGVALTLTQLSLEFGVSESWVRFTTCSLFVGLIIGASFWGIASDMIGRRPAFNITLFLTSVFGLAAGGGPNWIGTCGLFASLGLGVGGNMPVDAAIFLEFLPMASGGLLTMLAVYWSVGNLIASLLAWAFIPNFSCDGESVCTREDNMGWRYLVWTLGAITFGMFTCRYVFFTLYESPKFLVSRGRQEEAVAAVQGIAHKNKSTTWLTVDVMNEIGGYPEETKEQALSYKETMMRSFSKFSYQQVAPLFASKRLGITTALLWFNWTTIGMGYTLFNAFLPQYLSADATTYTTYRDYAITAVVGLPGPIIAHYTVDIKYIGRKGTMSFATLITGVMLFCFTAAPDPNTRLACSALASFFQMIMYGVLYAYTPEVFPAPNRGTGTGIASCLNRISGLCAPLIGIYTAGTNPANPIYAAGALLLASFVAMCLIPIETRDLNYGLYSQTGSKELESERGGAICERYRNETIEQALDSVVVGITELTAGASFNSLFDVQANAWSEEPEDTTPPKFSLTSNSANIWKFSTEDNSTASSNAFNGTLPRDNRLRQELNFNFTSCNGSITDEPFHGWLLQYKDVEDIEPVLHGSFDSESANFEIRGHFYLTSFDFSVEPYVTGVTWIGPITITFNGSIDSARSDDLLLGEPSPKWNATLGYTKLLNGSEVTDPNLAVRHGPGWHSFTVLILASALGLTFTI